MKKTTKTLSAAQLFSYGQIVLGVSLLLCLIIVPHYFLSTNQGGVSNYGTLRSTQWLFVLGFAAAAIGSLLAAIHIARSVSFRRPLQIGLVVLSALYVAVLLSTFSYKLSASFHRLHEQSSLILFFGMFIGSIWLRIKKAQDRKIRLTFIVFLVSISIGAATIFKLINLLFTAEVVSGIAFGYMLNRALKNN